MKNEVFKADERNKYNPEVFGQMRINHRKLQRSANMH